MDLDLTEEQKLIQDTARDFAKAELEPVAAKLDQEKDRATLLANLKKLAELGFMGLNVKEEYGGSEAGVVAFSVAMTEIARACASTAVTVSVNNMVCEVIQAIGTEEQKTSIHPENLLRRICRRQFRPDRNRRRLRPVGHDAPRRSRMVITVSSTAPRSSSPALPTPGSSWSGR